MNKKDDAFFDRADKHIRVANEHLSETSAGKVSASMMYGTARFNAFISACGFKSAEEMKEATEVTVEYFVGEYEKMLRENLEAVSYTHLTLPTIYSV